jgi:ferric-dicitrate binding protein FerR (iron transport regulator)
MSEQPSPSPPRRRRAVLATVLALAALAAAVPASGALAGGDAGGAGSAPSGGQQRTAPVQDRDTGRHGDCPGHHGGRSQSHQSDGATASGV